MDSFVGIPAGGGGGTPVMETRLNFASPGIDCFLGNGTYRVSDCEAKIICDGHPGQECTQFNGDDAQYTVYILKVAYCTETIPVETAYLEKFVESTGQWQQMGTHSAGGYNGWTWISWIIYPNHTTERWRIRWGGCTKEWKHVACQPNWICDLPLSGNESDGCGNKRYNSVCNPITAKPKIIDASPKTTLSPSGTPITVKVNEEITYKAIADQAITKWYWNFANPGAEGVQGKNIETISDTFVKAFSSPGDARVYAIGENANGYTDWFVWWITVEAAACIPSWACETPLNGYENDGCGNRRANSTCNPPQTSISFTSTPSGADIFIDGADQGVKTPNTAMNVPAGSHAYVLRLAGYNDYSGTVSVVSGQTASVTVTLTLTCVPTWKCEIPMNGYETDGCGNRRANPACNPPTAQIGNISFVSTPPGAGIFLDGHDQGAITPNTVSSIPVGIHAYTLKLAGYNDVTGTVSVVSGQTAAVTATLIASCVPVWNCELPLNGNEADGCGNRRANPACNPPQTGSISFASAPPGSEIFIDGADQNIKTPATISDIPTGTHTYTLKQTGYIDATGTVDVVLNQTTAASATLIPVAKPGIGMGTIMALLLAMGAVGAVIFVTREKKLPTARG